MPRASNEIQRAIVDCSSLLYLSPTRWLGMLPPQKLSPLNLSSCGCALFFDKYAHEPTYHTQIQRDLAKNAASVGLESQLSSAVLHTLRGVKSAVFMQWHEPPADLKTTLQSFMRNFSASETRTCVGVAIRQLGHPAAVPNTSAAPISTRPKTSDKTGRNPPATPVPCLTMLRCLPCHLILLLFSRYTKKLKPIICFKARSA
jgi:hypothetical protein